MIPTIGRVVHYRLSAEDAENIGIQRMMANERDANLARTGDVYPDEITRVLAGPDGAAVNLKVSLDGPDFFWVTEVTPEQFVETTGLGHWRVPARVTE